MPSDTVQTDSPPVILVADDDPLIRTLLIRLITKVQAVPVVVADGTSAIVAVHAYGASLTGALLDVTMPTTSGIEVAAYIQQQGLTIPIVLMSGGIPAHLLDGLYRLHAVTLLPKPFDLAVLQPILQRMVPSLEPPPTADSDAGPDPAA